jgi:hypothetical protein
LAADLLGAPLHPQFRLGTVGKAQPVWEGGAFTGGLGVGLGASF